MTREARDRAAAAVPRLALFDLDGTLLDGDTDVLWCAFLVDEGVLDGADFAARDRDISSRYASGAASPSEYCGFYAGLLAGRDASHWRPLRDRMLAERLWPRVGEPARALVAEHARRGDRLVLTTATNRFLTEPVAEGLGFDTLIATELEVDAAGAFTGRTRGLPNMREGKPRRLADWLAGEGLDGRALEEAVFYSDSRNDLPLLSQVGEPVAVEPDPVLAAEAERRGWRVLRWPRGGAG